jgi:hypothetical protein
LTREAPRRRSFAQLRHGFPRQLACDVTPKKSVVRVDHDVRGRWHRNQKIGDEAA